MNDQQQGTADRAQPFTGRCFSLALTLTTFILSIFGSKAFRVT